MVGKGEREGRIAWKYLRLCEKGDGGERERTRGLEYAGDVSGLMKRKQLGRSMTDVMWLWTDRRMALVI